MDARLPLSALTADQLMERAREYYAMAETATMVETRAALERLAARFEKMAVVRNGGMRGSLEAL